ncbi:MAG: S-adenosylmethionine:tRNA ribosyltransferase-isomerase [Thermodesulfobacteriota bacterium]|nr:MAG: S-adenosylmethionine:tRNA ribosyltransferase-isomerase [Thermodesulfobacteriota bacterium]
MKASDFDYHLPEEQIAYHPQDQRQNSRLLLLNKNSGEISHKNFYELPNFLKSGDLLVLNNTKVIPARLYGKRESGKEIEILLVNKLNEKVWECLVKNPKNNDELKFDHGLRGTLSKNESNVWFIEFEKNVDEYIEKYGKMPLPPYINREAQESDKISYQTVYADKKGAIAAPTAGLHFTRELLNQIKSNGVEIEYVTLHVGIGTFKPVKVENIEDHKMHAEYREIPIATATAINRAKAEGRRVIAVGTTVVRTLESSVTEDGEVIPQIGQTDLFIVPGFEFKVVDALITNFHLPRSTLLMLVSAFSKYEYIFKAYDDAREMGYRFLSYGDAMFIN